MLTNVKIVPSNCHFKLLGDKCLVGKSDENKDEFDVLHFACRHIKQISIPSNIKVISSFAFASCKFLTKVEIPEDSNLQIIGSNAFAWSRTNEIFIPSKVSIICQMAFYSNLCLSTVKIAANSNLQIIGKKAFYDYAKQHQFHFFEVSCLDGTNIDSLFTEISQV